MSYRHITVDKSPKRTTFVKLILNECQLQGIDWAVTVRNTTLSLFQFTEARMSCEAPRALD